MLSAIILFAVTYICLLVFSKHQAPIAFTSALIFMLTRIITPGQAFAGIDWNVLMMIAGTMGTVYLFTESGMPELLANKILKRMPDARWAIVALVVFAGAISAFVDNVATVVMIAPIGLTIAKKLKISPVPVVIAIAASSNLQGAATLVGDTTAIMMAGEAKMDFLDFFFYQGKPSIFWVVQAGAIFSAFILFWMFRNQTQKDGDLTENEVTDHVPTFLLLATIFLLILASFIHEKPVITNGLICMSIMLVGILYEGIRHHDLLHGFRNAISAIDFSTLLLLGSLFVVIAGIEEAGLIDALARLFVSLAGDNLFLVYSIILWGSAIISAFIDNIPFVATMLPVVTGIAAYMHIDPTILYFGLLSGATLGGNILPIGSSAGISAVSILRKNGYEPTTKDFMRISVPFDIGAVTSAYILIWLIWS